MESVMDRPAPDALSDPPTPHESSVTGPHDDSDAMIVEKCTGEPEVQDVVEKVTENGSRRSGGSGASNGDTSTHLKEETMGSNGTANGKGACHGNGGGGCDTPADPEEKNRGDPRVPSTLHLACAPRFEFSHACTTSIARVHMTDGEAAGKDGDAAGGGSNAAVSKATTASHARKGKRGRSLDDPIADGPSPERRSASPVVRSARLSRTTETPREAAAALDIVTNARTQQPVARRGRGGGAKAQPVPAPGAAHANFADAEETQVRPSSPRSQRRCARSRYTCSFARLPRRGLGARMLLPEPLAAQR